MTIQPDLDGEVGLLSVEKFDVLEKVLVIFRPLQWRIFFVAWAADWRACLRLSACADEMHAQPPPYTHPAVPLVVSPVRLDFWSVRLNACLSCSGRGSLVRHIIVIGFSIHTYVARGAEHCQELLECCVHGQTKAGVPPTMSFSNGRTARPSPPACSVDIGVTKGSRSNATGRCSTRTGRAWGPAADGPGRSSLSPTRPIYMRGEQRVSLGRRRDVPTVWMGSLLNCSCSLTSVQVLQKHVQILTAEPIHTLPSICGVVTPRRLFSFAYRALYASQSLYCLENLCH